MEDNGKFGRCEEGRSQEKIKNLWVASFFEGAVVEPFVRKFEDRVVRPEIINQFHDTIPAVSKDTNQAW